MITVTHMSTSTNKFRPHGADVNVPRLGLGSEDEFAIDMVLP